MARGRLLDSVSFLGHRNVTGTNRATLEVTTEGFLTPRGDCIIGVSADHGCDGLPSAAKDWLQGEGKGVLMRITVGTHSYEFKAAGSEGLSLSDPKSMVVRRSDFVSPRTVAVRATSAACDIPREIIRSLSYGAKGRIEIFAVDGTSP